MPSEPQLSSLQFYYLTYLLDIYCQHDMSRVSINFEYDDDHYDALLERQGNAGKNNETLRDSFFSIPMGLIVAVQ